MITLDPDHLLPLYRQLYDRLRAQILSGELAPDARLPSVRELVQELSVSRNTVEGAYLELYAEGYIYSKPRSGYFVSPLDQEVAPRSLAEAPDARRRMPEPAPDCRFDFHPARLDPGSFPVETWRRCFVESLRESPAGLVQYGHPQGEPELRLSLKLYLERSRGVVCDTDQIVICSGLQQSLDLVAQLLRQDHAVVGVENPGYFLPRSVFRNHGFEIEPVAVGPAGLDPELLKKGRASIAYLTPSHQLPLGCVMPVASRLKLIDWADSGRFLIEDDYDSELRYLGRPIPSLQGLRPGGNIVYAGTFSKVLSPALRVSYLVLPPALLVGYRRQFGDYFCSVSLLEQRTLARFMDQGHWERQIRRMRATYKRKHDRLLQAVARHFGSQARVVGQGAGLHVVLQLFPPAAPAKTIEARARQAGLRLLPIADFYLTGGPELTTLLLGFGSLPLEEIDAAIGELAGLCG